MNDPTDPTDLIDVAGAAGAGVDGLSFEQALAQLDVLVRRMESGELGLDESIAAYRRGACLAKFCQAKLADAESQIQKLDGDVLTSLSPDDMRGAAA